MKSKNSGEFGENAVCDALLSRGYTILKRNFHSRYGEIDIIAKDGNCTVFIEVKTRLNTEYGNASEYVTYTKKKKIIKTAYYYLNGDIEQEIRFDVAEVYYTYKGDLPEVYKINYIKHAFIS